MIHTARATERQPNMAEPSAPVLIPVPLQSTTGDRLSYTMHCPTVSLPE